MYSCTGAYPYLPPHGARVFLPSGPILAVAVCVFGNCSWSALYCCCFCLRELLRFPLACSLGALSCPSLVVYSLGTLCAITACASESLSWSSLFSGSLRYRVPLRSQGIGRFGDGVGLVSLPEGSLPAAWLKKLR